MRTHSVDRQNGGVQNQSIPSVLPTNRKYRPVNTSCKEGTSPSTPGAAVSSRDNAKLRTTVHARRQTSPPVKPQQGADVAFALASQPLQHGEMIRILPLWPRRFGTEMWFAQLPSIVPGHQSPHHISCHDTSHATICLAQRCYAAQLECCLDELADRASSSATAKNNRRSP